MGLHLNHERFTQLLALFRQGDVEQCLHYPGMAEVPQGYNRYARADCRARGADWDDYCPAYAFAVLTREGYTLPEDDESLEVLWDELGGQSSKLWPQVKEVVVDAWGWLRRHARG